MENSSERKILKYFHIEVALKKSYTLSQKSARYQRKSAREPQFFFAGKLKGKVPVNKSAVEHICAIFLFFSTKSLCTSPRRREHLKKFPFNLKKCIYLPENNKTVMVNVFFSRIFSEKVPMNKKKCPVTFPRK